MDGDRAVSALRWWQEAGVDTLVAEEPRDWLAAAAVAEPKRYSEAAGRHPPTSLREAGPALSRERERGIELPETLEAFQEWLLSGDVPFASPSAARVGAAGDAASGLMVMVDMPSDDDVAAGRLLTGEPGALFDRMMAWIGRSRETLYLAPMSPVRTPTGTLPIAAFPELATTARHHVGLVKPKFLLLFGETCAKALLGAPIAEARGKWHELDTQAGKISTLVTIRPEKLVDRPGLKKLARDDVQLLREELKP